VWPLTRTNPTSPWFKRDGQSTPYKLGNSLLFSRSVSLSLFLFSRREGVGDMMGDHVGSGRYYKKA
jgi:hypothetical protein